MPKLSSQPYCRVCGKAIAKHVVTVWVEPVDKDRTYDRDSDFARHAYADNVRSKADCQRLTNHKVVSVLYQGDKVRRFGEWDGESYVDEHFCNGTCVRRYAYMMAREYPDVICTEAAEAARARAKKGKAA